jgi:cellulose synthase/poly-beta-1,6-N-acetylglucosamine synthase-like glycosyltransferase
MYHDKLASVQAQHWYPNIPNGHPLQPNNRFFFDGVMKGRAGRGSTPNAGTMNVFNYEALIGIDPEYPDEAKFCIYSVTEDKATEIEYFCRGYYAIYHPYVVSSGVPANTLAKEFDRLLRWARGNFVILSRRNCVFHSHGMKPLFRLWAIEGTIYPINGLITLLFYFACIIYVAFG